ncbi:MAG TPA: hypothetical protein VKX16_10365 [Chloroflexota bacterium]|nr:hypothetical protein [Chloroflexota bacterium]
MPRPTELTREQMLAVKEHVRSRLLHDYHSYLLTARLFQRVGNIPMARVDNAKAKEILAMLDCIKDEPEVPGEQTQRLLEQLEGADS